MNTDTMPAMAINLGGILMKNPVNVSAGTLGQAWQFENFYDVAELGAVTLKGASAEPWLGNPQPRMCEVASGVMNSIGLMNPGVCGLIEQFGTYFEQLAQKGCAVICQAVGHSVDEYVRAIELFEEHAPFAAGFEVNISCPNIKATEYALGFTPKGAAEIIRAIRSRTNRPLLVKMAPERIVETARALEDAGADGLSLINSIPGMALDVSTRKSRISRPVGGVSGPCLHPIALRMVWEVSQAVALPINGMGGIMSGRDAAEFILAGATSVSVGMANLIDPQSSSRLLHELVEWVNSQGVDDVNELIGAFEC